MDRIATFEQFIANSPDDPFPRYGLAMEYKNQGKHAEAQAVFDVLLERFADYVPTYFHAAANLATLGRSDEAISVCERGIDVSRKANDAHALGELEASLAQLRAAAP